MEGRAQGLGPRKTLYNRFIRWSRLGVFDRIFAALAGQGPRPERIMIDSTVNRIRSVTPFHVSGPTKINCLRV